ncbi:unnamed protein product [Alopecurus aequalis]
MRPSSLPVLLPLLLASKLAIAHADSTASAPAPSLEEATSSPPPPPPPSWAPIYPSPPPPPVWAPTSQPPPLPPVWAPTSQPPPPPPAWVPVSPPPPPTPVSTSVSPPPPPPPSSTPVSPPLPPPTGWTPVANVKDKTIQQVGNFAVRIYTLTWQVELVFVDVISGSTQPSDGGYNYRLVLTVDSPHAKSAHYDAVVWGIVGTSSWELRSFVPK